MIDMTFLLLIFFMVTSHLTDMDVSIPVGLPEAELGVTPDDRSNDFADDLIVLVDHRQGRIGGDGYVDQ